MDRSIINVCTSLWLLLAYFISRFIVGKYSIIFLFSACSILVFRIFISNQRSQPLVFWAPTLMMSMSSLLGLALYGSGLAIYAGFTFLCLLIHACGYSLFRPMPPKPILYLALFFIILVTPFIFVPSLSQVGTQPFDAAAKAAAELRKINNAVEERESFRAFFYHGAELGQFAACVIIVFSQSVKNQIRSEGRRYGSAYIIGELSIYVLLGVIIYFSDSLISKLLAAYALAARYTDFRYLALIPATALIAQFITQISAPAATASFLQSGSFWWRYKMAENVMLSSSAFSFTPEAVGGQINWTHSIFLDFVVVFGIAGALLIIANQMIMVLVPRYRGGAFGWSCLYLVVVAIQPVGASAIYIVMALSLAYAESTSAPPSSPS